MSIERELLIELLSSVDRKNLQFNIAPLSVEREDCEYVKIFSFKGPQSITVQIARDKTFECYYWPTDDSKSKALPVTSDIQDVINYLQTYLLI